MKNIIDKEDILIGPGQLKAADKVSQKPMYKIYNKIYNVNNESLGSFPECGYQINHSLRLN